jgi:uncharacterized protein YcfJ
MTMRRMLLIGGLAALIAAPSLAEARDACQQRNHERKVTGTLLGAAGGALIGGAIGDGTGAVIGGLGGAAVGHEVGRINCNKPRAYYQPAPRRSATGARYSSASAEPRCYYEDRPYYDERGRLVNDRVQVCR